MRVCAPCEASLTHCIAILVAALPLPRALDEVERDEEWLIRNRVDFGKAIVTIVSCSGEPFWGKTWAMDDPIQQQYYRCYFSSATSASLDMRMCSVRTTTTHIETSSETMR